MRIEYYKLLKNRDITKATGYDDEDSMKLLRKIGSRIVVIDIGILYNIHRHMN